MSKRAVAVIVAGFFTVFIAFAIRYAYGILLPQMLPTLGTSKAGAGVIYSSYFLAYTIFSPIIGALVDKWDARKLLTLFVLLLGLGAVLMSTTQSVIQAVLFFGLAGIGHSACWVPVVAVVQRWVSEKRRGVALAAADMGSATGIVFWSLLIPVIVGVYGWRGSWISLGVMAFVVAGMNFFLVRSHPPAADSESTTSKPPAVSLRAAYKSLLGDARFWLIGFSYQAIGFSILIPFAFITTYAVEELDISYQTAAVLVTIIALAGVVGKLILGYLSDLVGRLKVMATCGILTAVGGLGIAGADGLVFLLVATAVFGFGYGAIWPVYAAASRDFFPVETSGSVIALWTLILAVGSILSPFIGGWVIDTSGCYAWAFILVCIASSLSWLLLIPVGIIGKKRR